MGVFSEKPVRALAVDLPNLCIKSDPEVYMGNSLRPPLLFDDIVHIMRDIEEMELRIPVFYVIDHHVYPHAMTAQQAKRLEKMETASPRSPERIWRMGKAGGLTPTARRNSVAQMKADHAICNLVNQRKIAVLTEDRFRGEIEAGRLNRPEELLRFHPVRSTRDQPFRFVNESARTRLDLRALVADLTEDEFWDEWERCARVMVQHVGKTQRKSDIRLIDQWVASRNSSDSAAATAEEIAAYLASVETDSMQALPVPLVKRKSHKVRQPKKSVHDSIASVGTRGENNVITVTTAGPSRPNGAIARELGRPQDPQVAVPKKSPPRPVEATFVFLKQGDLLRHRDRQVEVIGRVFSSGDSLQFRLYGAGLALSLDLRSPPAGARSYGFASATGLLQFDGRNWALRDAVFNGEVTNDRVQQVASGAVAFVPPRFSPWGRLPARLHARKSKPSDDEPTGPRHTPTSRPDEPVTTPPHRTAATTTGPTAPPKPGSTPPKPPTEPKRHVPPGPTQGSSAPPQSAPQASGPVTPPTPAAVQREDDADPAQSGAKVEPSRESSPQAMARIIAVVITAAAVITALVTVLR
jgi:hypothetical protein